MKGTSPEPPLSVLRLTTQRPRQVSGLLAFIGAVFMVFGPESGRDIFRQVYCVGTIVYILYTVPFDFIDQRREKMAAKAKAKSLTSLERISFDLNIL